MAQFVFWLAVGFACVLGACVVAGLLCKTGEKLRALRRAGWACVLAAIVAGTTSFFATGVGGSGRSTAGCSGSTGSGSFNA